MTDSFWIERSTDGGSTWQRIAIVARDGSGSYAYTDGGLQPGTTYEYRLQARGSESEYSSTFSETTSGTVPVQKTQKGASGIMIVAEKFPFGWTSGTYADTSENWSPYVVESVMSTNQHGYSSLTVDVEFDNDRAAEWYERANGKLFVIAPDGRKIWEGKMYEFVYRPFGLSVVAYGGWTTFGRHVYTGVFSLALYDRWQVLDKRAFSLTADTNYPELYEHKTEGLIYVSPKEGSSAVSYTQDTAVGVYFFYTDYFSALPNRILFDYEMYFTSTGTPSGYYTQVFLLESSPNQPQDGIWVSGSTLWSLEGDGTTQTGSVSVSAGSGTRGLNFTVKPRSSDSITYSNQTGTEYVLIDNLRILGGSFHKNP